MPKLDLEIKIGMFITVGLVILIVFIGSIGDFYPLRNTYRLEIYFENVGGLKKSSPVKMAGVDAGVVESISIVEPDAEGSPVKIRVGTRINESIKIPQDSEAYVSTLGLLGERYIEIYPGLEQDNYLRDGDKLEGRCTISLREIMNSGKDIAKSLKNILGNVEDITDDEEFRESLKVSIENLEGATGEIKSILEKINSGQGTIGKLVNEDGIYNNANGLVKDLKENPWKLLQKPRRR